MPKMPDTEGVGPAATSPFMMDRRGFVQRVGLGAAAWYASQLPLGAAPTGEPTFEQLVPADKQLDPAWVNSLFDKGERPVMQGDDLNFVGMPIGGLCCGQVYLGGDGRLWHWDIFNRYEKTGSKRFSQPYEPASPFRQEFVLRVNGEERPLTREGFKDVSFHGTYPIGTVEYRDKAVPLEVTLEAFSPFVPLNLEDSSHPATFMRYRVHNASSTPVEAELIGRIENPVCLHSAWAPVRLRNRTVSGEGFTFLECSGSDGEAAPAREVPVTQWTSPKEGATWSSSAFKLEHQFVNFEVDAVGARSAERVEVWLLVGRRPVRKEMWTDENPINTTIRFDVLEHKGEEARVELRVTHRGDLQPADLGRCTRSDAPIQPPALEQLPDYGNIGIGLIGDGAEIRSANATGTVADRPLSEIGRRLRLQPGETMEVVFVVSWYFPNLELGFDDQVWRMYPAFDIPGEAERVGRRYGVRFSSAFDVVRHLALRVEELSGLTREWRDTWYDSTLPWWFLDRSFSSISALATNTTYLFGDGRFWGWEGVGSCPGTCTHVYGYTQAMGRIFPEIERQLRERVDYDRALELTGCVSFRGGPLPQEAVSGWAVDGQSMVIMRTLREHQMSPDDQFLRRIWPQVKQALDGLIQRDTDRDGLLDGPQFNTLDSAWYGKIAWLSGLYVAALRAGEEMARDLGDRAFARRCRQLHERGWHKLRTELYNGEYFQNVVDPGRLDSVNSGSGCHIDQLLGASWSRQVGLHDAFASPETTQALKSLWRYNFLSDVGPYREVYKQGRRFAEAGDAGLLMCSFPRDDWGFKEASGEIKGRAFTGYLNECMNGFEYHVAGHMVWEGMVMEGLAIARAIHDRYRPSKRNPWNEIEAGDHYARSMASYGVYVAACGFEYHGPKQRLGFAPRLTPENFRGAFTAAEGWGTYSQTKDDEGFQASIALKQGRLPLSMLVLTPPAGWASINGEVEITGRRLIVSVALEAGRVMVTLPVDTVLATGEMLRVRLSLKGRMSV